MKTIISKTKHGRYYKSASKLISVPPKGEIEISDYDYAIIKELKTFEQDIENQLISVKGARRTRRNQVKAQEEE